MQPSVQALLAQLASSASSERDKGDKFERLVRRFLLAAPQWAPRFSDVHMWSDWSGNDKRPDHGIDLVAVERESVQVRNVTNNW